MKLSYSKRHYTKLRDKRGKILTKHRAKSHCPACVKIYQSKRKKYNRKAGKGHEHALLKNTLLHSILTMQF